MVVSQIRSFGVSAATVGYIIASKTNRQITPFTVGTEKDEDLELFVV